ncbi:MAG TPA: efflux RND transporter permease subunit [Myxococcota bacterium]|nr:efflux RND transporter permease subunit [Myxococcota bacterium]HRY92186.1 efflux RND transporter permease subunit [Myxococcota bacterium]HSA21715.1 efflux RND transporter permease subunit [Myxococcota bacterium]
MLTRAALKNPVAVLMIALALCVLGVTSLRRIPVDLFPTFSMPMVIVGVVYPGAGPKDVESSITYPLERVLTSVPNVNYVESTSRQGIAVLRVFFDWEADVDVGASDCVQKIQQVMSSLPPGTQQPFVVKMDMSNMAVLSLALSGGLDDRGLYDLAYNVLMPQLERIQGVSTVSISGGRIRQINVLAEREALAARGLSAGDLVSAIGSANFLMPSGNLRVAEVDYNLFTATQIDEVQRLGDVPVRVGGQDAYPVLVRDVATLEDGGENVTNVVRINGKRGVGLYVRKQPGANTVEVVDRLLAALPGLTGLPAGVSLEPVFDQSLYIRNSIGSLTDEALLGAGLSILIIFLFLRMVRSTLVIALSIPLSILTTFLLLYFLGGQTLNTFTLGGLALGVGRLLDDSIVVLENIYRHRARGEPAEQASLEGAREVAMPVLASTIATIVVFFPVVFLAGIAKALFIPLTLAIVFSLAASYFVSMTVIPVLCVRFLPPPREPRRDAPTRGERFMARWAGLITGLEQLYRWLLTVALGHRAVVIALILLGLGGAAALAPRLGTEFYPATDESQLRVVVRAPVGTRVERTAALTRNLQAVVRETLGADNILSLMADVGARQSGGGGMFSQNTGPHSAQLRIQLVPPTRRPFTDIQAADKLRRVLGDKLPGVRVFIDTGGIVQRILSFGSEQPIDVEILGYDLEAARGYAAQILAAVESTPGATDVRLSREEDYPELDILVDREKAGRLGLTTRDVAQTALTSVSGNLNSPSIYTDPITGKEYQIIVRFREADRQTLADLEDVPLVGRGGNLVSLRSVADVVPGAGPVQVDRKYQQRIIHVTANVKDRPLGDVAGEIERKLADLPRPPGFDVRLGGQTAQQKESFESLAGALLLALMLVYMTMASQFRSLLDPFIVMFSVPLGVIGVVLALWLTDTSINIMSAMGVIMMVGIVLSNGILLVEFANVRRRQGLDRREAILEAGTVRLRPILMTVLTTLLGLLPMAIGIGEGSESNVPLARAVVGGLIVSTFFTLILIPILYTLFHRRAPAPASAR